MVASIRMHAARMQHCRTAAARLHQLLWIPQHRTATCLASSRSELVQPHHAEAAYNSQPVQQVEQVPVPLCRRPAQHTEQLSGLMQWRQHVLDEISNVRDGFSAADGGPSTSDLQREVNWVLDDVIAAWREADSQQWQTCSWQQLDLELSAAFRRSRATQGWQVLLRAPVEHLQQLWHLRLQERVPFQYLLAAAHWRDLVLAVGPGILVPRPETELMVDLAAAALDSNPALSTLPSADLGTGSGALAIATAQLLQQRGKDAAPSASNNPQQQPAAAEPYAAQARVYAVDLSPTAVAYATANAAACGVQESVQAVQGSWFEPLQHLNGQLGGLLSNPPYIPRSDIESGLQAEVALHEPMTALDGGPGEGMDSLKVICVQAVSMLAPGGYIVLETAGAQQAPLVQQLLQSLQAPAIDAASTLSQQSRRGGGPAFADVFVHDDCYGVPRFVSATRTHS